MLRLYSSPSFSLLRLYYLPLDSPRDEFQDYNVFGSEWVGLSNYEYVLSDPIFWRAMRVTLVFTPGTVPVNIGISLGLAWLISQLKEGSNILLRQSIYQLLPPMVPIRARSSIPSGRTFKQVYRSLD